MHFGEKYSFGWGTTSRLLRVLKKQVRLVDFDKLKYILIDFDKI